MPFPVKVTINNKQYTFKELSKLYNINLYTVKNRYFRGDRGKRVVRPTNKASLRLTINGKKYSPIELSKKYGIDRGTIINRYRYGKRGLDLVKPPKKQAKHVKNRMKVKVNGKYYNFFELSKLCNISANHLRIRYRKGYRDNDLIKPLNFKYINIPFKGKLYPIKDFCKLYNINYYTVRRRYQHGLRGDDLIKPLEK